MQISLKQSHKTPGFSSELKEDLKLHIILYIFHVLIIFYLMDFYFYVKTLRLPVLKGQYQI